MVAIAIPRDHLFHRKNNPSQLAPHLHPKPPPIPSTFSSPTPPPHHHLRLSTTPLPTSPTCIPSSSPPPDTSTAPFPELFHLSLQSHEYGKSFYYLQRLVSSGHSPCPNKCALLINGLSSSSSSSSSTLTLLKAERVIEILELHGSPNVFAYTALLTSLCSLNQIDAALSFLPRMRLHLCPPDTSTYNTLIAALSSSGRLDEAVTLLDDMPSHGLRPDSFTYDVILEGMHNEGRIDLSVAFMERMVSEGHVLHIASYNGLISALCKTNKVMEAMEILRKLQDIGCNPNSKSFHILVYGLWKSGERLMALELVMEMLCTGVDIDECTYTTLVKCLCLDGMVDEAMDLVDDMEIVGKLRPTIVTYNALLVGLCKERRVVEAIEVFVCEIMRVDYPGRRRRRRKSGDLGRSTIPNDLTYEILVEGIALEGYLDEAEELVKVLIRSNLISRESGRRVEKMVLSISDPSSFSTSPL